MIRFVVGLIIIFSGAIGFLACLAEIDGSKEGVASITVCAGWVIGGAVLVYFGRRAIRRKKLVISLAIRALNANEATDVTRIAKELGLMEADVMAILSKWRRPESLVPSGSGIVVSHQQAFPSRDSNATPATSSTTDTSGVLQEEFLIRNESTGAELLVKAVKPQHAALLAQTNENTPKFVLPPLALNGLVRAVPDVARLVKGGKVVQILNPELLEQGKMLASKKGGNLGILQSLHNSKFKGHLRFGDPKSMRALAAPAAAWQVFSLVTLQYYLGQINSKLRMIETQVRSMRREMRNEIWGEVMARIEQCQHFEELLGTLSATEGEMAALEEAYVSISKAYQTVSKNLDDFSEKVASISEDFTNDTLEKGDLIETVEEAMGIRQYDAQLLLAAGAVRHRLAIMKTLASGGDPTRVSLNEQQARRGLEEMKQDVRDIGDAFQKLVFPNDKINLMYFFSGEAEQKCAEYIQQTDGLRALLSDNSREMFPDFDVNSPSFIELSMDEDGNLVSAFSSSTMPSAVAKKAKGTRRKTKGTPK